MSRGVRRKDKNGLVLKEGESQRKDLTYQYRFTCAGKRKYLYAPTLMELREKETEVQKQISNGMDYAKGQISVIELVERRLNLQRGFRDNTKKSYTFVINTLKKCEFGYAKICDVKMSDAKQWLLSLYDEGRKRGTILLFRGVVRAAFGDAYDEEVINRNPFDFKTDFIPKEGQSREALTPLQQKVFLEFLKHDYASGRLYDMANILLETGMRIGEFCGLTESDLSFEERDIRIERQMTLTTSGERHIGVPKSRSAIRFIPMSTSAYISFKNLISSKSSDINYISVDGYHDFVLTANTGYPYSPNYGALILRSAVEEYNNTHDIPLPCITPHVLRHTFCTNKLNAGMDIKSLQYVMGHASVSTTLNVYAHTRYERVKEQMLSCIG